MKKTYFSLFLIGLLLFFGSLSVFAAGSCCLESNPEGECCKDGECACTEDCNCQKE